MGDNTYNGAADAFRGVLSDLQEAPHLVAAGADAIRLRGGSRECLNYNMTLSDPRQRLAERLQIYPAVARLVWMMAANNRLADIAFHEPRVAAFTDDDLTVPGSDYGMRLRQPQPGLDQVLGAIGRLRSEADGRRAAVVIWQPVDAVRDSKDIPCAFGLLFHNRGGILLTTVIMRSNNAFSLLPFNIFEFSLLAEIVSVEAGLQLGPITYFAGSMHFYDTDADKVGAFLKTAALVAPSMHEMPTNVSPLAQLTTLAQFEADLRHGSTGIDSQSVHKWLDRATADLTPYWAQFAFILVSGVAARVDQNTLEATIQRVEPEFRRFLPQLSAKTADEGMNVAADLFGNAAPAPRPVLIHRTELMQKFAAFAEAHERATNTPIGAARLLRAQGIVADRLAARGAGGPLTQEAFTQALDEAR